MGTHLFNRHTTWTVIFSLLVALGLGACSDVSNAPAPAPGPTVLTITTDSTLPSGSIGVAYNTALAAAGGTQPFTWTIVGGGAPAPGLTMSSSGVISGTPNTIGSTTRTYRVVDSKQPSSQEALKDLTIAINAVPQPTITTPSPLTSSLVNQPYPSTTLTAVGGTPPYTWSSTVTPPLPTGLTFNAATATISGTPSTTEINVKHTFSVTDSFSPTPQTVTKELALTISNAPVPPNITTTTASLAPNGTVGAPYSRTLAATPGTGTLTWGIQSGTLPTGVTLNPSTGVISGTPSTANTFTFTPQVTDSLSLTDSTPPSLSITIGPATPPNITTTTASLAPNGTVGVPYSRTLAASGGTGSFIWGVISGTLPSNLSLNPSTGVISGSPGSAGTSTFTVQVTDSLSLTDSTPPSLSITIDPAPVPPNITTTTASLAPNGTVGVPYSRTLAASGGTGTLTWSIQSGTLPTGVTLNPSTGVISGTPSTANTFTFTPQVTDSLSLTDSTPPSLSITIGPATPPNITTTTASLAPNGTVGVPYSRTLAASGGTGTLTWSIQSGTLPTDITLNPSTGVISGTPSTANTFTFTPQVTDSLSLTDTTPPSLSITIDPPSSPLTITTLSLDPATANSVYSFQLAASGGTGAGTYNWILANDSPTTPLPGALTLTSTGLLSGTAPIAGTYDLKFTVTDQTLPSSQTVSTTLTLTVN